MRRILTGFAATALLAVVPTLALADNQQMADQIANRLRSSGEMSGYKVGVKFQDGTVWLRGHVQNEEQMNTALKLVFRTPGVNRVVNDLTVAAPSDAAQSAQSEPAAPSQPVAQQRGSKAATSGQNPLRGKPTALAAQKPQQPQKIGLAQRLEAIVAHQSESDSPARSERASRYFYSPPAKKVNVPAQQLQARAVPAEQSQVRTVSAEEFEDSAPRRMAAPQQSRQVAPARVMQPNTDRPCASGGGPMPMYNAAGGGGGVAPARYDQPSLPNYAWPSYAAYPNYAAVTYPKQYSPTAWPYIGPFYPYPQVPLGWRKVTLEWDDGWWFLDFKDQPASCWHR